LIDIVFDNEAIIDDFNSNESAIASDSDDDLVPGFQSASSLLGPVSKKLPTSVAVSAKKATVTTTVTKAKVAAAPAKTASKAAPKKAAAPAAAAAVAVPVVSAKKAPVAVAVAAPLVAAVAAPSDDDEDDADVGVRVPAGEFNPGLSDSGYISSESDDEPVAAVTPARVATPKTKGKAVTATVGTIPHTTTSGGAKRKAPSTTVATPTAATASSRTNINGSSSSATTAKRARTDDAKTPATPAKVPSNATPTTPSTPGSGKIVCLDATCKKTFNNQKAMEQHHRQKHKASATPAVAANADDSD
jgi:hypothetical protein